MCQLVSPKWDSISSMVNDTIVVSHTFYCMCINRSMTLRNIVQLFIHPGGIKFVLNGIAYQNHSIVSPKDIGEDSHALLCITNFYNCCRPPYTSGMKSVLGNWFFPNETRVPSTSKQWDFHRTRSHMVVYLHRRRGEVKGIYQCVLPDAMNVTKTIYIGIYIKSKPLLTH